MGLDSSNIHLGPKAYDFTPTMWRAYIPMPTSNLISLDLKFIETSFKVQGFLIMMKSLLSKYHNFNTIDSREEKWALRHNVTF